MFDEAAVNIGGTFVERDEGGSRHWLAGLGSVPIPTLPPLCTVSSAAVPFMTFRAVAPAAFHEEGRLPPDSDYAFTETPTLAFSDRGGHGLVVVEASVSAKGVVTATTVVSNATGDEALAFLAERRRARREQSRGHRGDAWESLIDVPRAVFEAHGVMWVVRALTAGVSPSSRPHRRACARPAMPR